ncbi:serine threonine protein kinase [Moniliophthora roreri MCA 2997]|uniref:Serine threonine protein kinase n=2 Tax=Moniliophthora roreri TaxID=221103 RepID=V2XRQ4_MONRO|nr:serine threonine protein kinase [Moniliophthora roreri MCA 2997]KAI3619943.1 serine threonine protein kinase [Moniliophthora roreri]
MSVIDRNSQFYQSLVAPINVPTPIPSILQCLNANESQEDGQDAIFGEIMDLDTVFERGVESGKIEMVFEPSASTNDTESTEDTFTQGGGSNDLMQPFYPLSERWKWVENQDMEDIDEVYLSSGSMCSCYVTIAQVSGKQLKYVRKTWRIDRIDDSFYAELALYNGHMRRLQGDVVPSIITVFTGPCTLSVAMEPPHHSFWVEASPDMPLMLKERCVAAYERLHGCGVLHGDVELRHMLIGGDGNVTLIDFHGSRALEPEEDVRMRRANPGELRREMRKVKVLLDYPGAREMERKRISDPEPLWVWNQLREYPSYRASIPEIPEDQKWDAPFELKEYNAWINPLYPPRRFIMPGQGPSDVLAGLQQFLQSIDPEFKLPVPLDKLDKRVTAAVHPCHGETRKRSFDGSLHDDAYTSKRPRRDAVDVSLSIQSNKHPIPSTTAAPSTSRKRNSGTQTDLSPTKRRRLNDGEPAVDSVVDYTAYSPDPHGRSYVSSQRVPSATTDEIHMLNSGQYATVQLPHPTLLELFPKHARWQTPDIQHFSNRRLQECEHITAIPHPDQSAPSPREKCARGFLTKAMRCSQQKAALTFLPPLEEHQWESPVIGRATCIKTGRNVSFRLENLVEVGEGMSEEISRDPTGPTTILSPWHRPSLSLFKVLLRPLWFYSQ